MKKIAGIILAAALFAMPVYAADIDMLVNINPHISRPDRLIPENERINLW